MKLTATTLIIGWACDGFPRVEIPAGTVFDPADYDGHPGLKESIARAIRKGGCLVDGHRAGELRPKDDGVLTLPSPRFGEGDVTIRVDPDHTLAQLPPEA